MNYPVSLLVHILRDPIQAVALSSAQWDILIRQARHANLLGRLCFLLAEAGVKEQVPAAPRNHLQAAAYLAERQYYSVCHEIDALLLALRSVDVPLTLLKGAAYSATGLPASAGRIFADVDILVARDRLGDAEAALMKYGWSATALSAYDQQYYRRWMHELPPMHHLQRGSVLDVHHTILPPTARYHPDPAHLLVDRMEVQGRKGVYTLSPVDMVLHSATHLFHEGEADNALRDLSDLDRLLRYFADLDGQIFWSKLVSRAKTLQLTRPVWLALHFAAVVYRTPVPSFILSAIQEVAPSRGCRFLLEWMYGEIFQPQHVTTQTRYSALARHALYIRGHWLRMPAHLLTMHLLRKAFTPEFRPEQFRQ